MDKITKFLFYKKYKCPYCGTNLRFPIHKGKKLKIICPNCKNSFIIEIKNNPLISLKKLINIKYIKKLYNENPLLFYGIIVIILLILYSIITFIFKIPNLGTDSLPKTFPTDGKII